MCSHDNEPHWTLFLYQPLWFQTLWDHMNHMSQTESPDLQAWDSTQSAGLFFRELPALCLSAVESICLVRHRAVPQHTGEAQDKKQTPNNTGKYTTSVAKLHLLPSLVTCWHQLPTSFFFLFSLLKGSQVLCRLKQQTVRGGSVSYEILGFPFYSFSVIGITQCLLVSEWNWNLEVGSVSLPLVFPFGVLLHQYKTPGTKLTIWHYQFTTCLFLLGKLQQNTWIVVHWKLQYCVNPVVFK